MSPQKLSAQLRDSIAGVDAVAAETSPGGTVVNPPGLGTLSDQALGLANQLKAPTISPSVVTGTVRTFEAMLVAALGALTFAPLTRAAAAPPLMLAAIVAGVLIVVLFLQAADCYQVAIMRTRLRQVVRVAIALSLAFGVLVVGEFLGRSAATLPPTWLEYWFGATLGTIVLLRLGLAKLLRHWTAKHRLEHRAVIVGGGEAAADLISLIEKDPTGAIRICGIFDDRNSERSPPTVAGYPKLGSITGLIEFGRIAHVDMLIVNIPITAEKRLLALLKQLWVLPVDIHLAPHAEGLDFRDRVSPPVGSVPFVDVIDKPVADWDAVVKRLMDLVIASAAIAVLSPLLLATALAIRLDSPGPVLFRQKRYGFKNEVIEVLKFRSMYDHMSDPLARRVVKRNDPRVTRVGRFIRKTSIDELPQLFNVIGGKLSLVGPRPHAVNAHTNDRLWEEVVDGYFARHKVKPGITGWAQINGCRGEVDRPEKIRERVAHDIDYIENWSILFDLYILARTPLALLRDENAY